MAVTLSGMTLLTSNDNEANWSGTDGPDPYNTFIQGANSESWQVSKNTTETALLILAAALAAGRGIFVIWMKSNLHYYYTEITAELQSSAGNFKEFILATSANPGVSGDFKPIALDYVNKGLETGTFVPASYSLLRLFVDNSVSGNIKLDKNTWIDAIYFGEGLVISGTTDTDKCFTEAAAIDQTQPNRFGILENYNGVIFGQGDLELAGTLVSNSENLVFVETPNGYDRYNLTISGAISFVDSNISSEGLIVDYDMDCSTATSFSMSGGSITGANTLTLIDGQFLNEVILNSIGSSSIDNDPNNCSWNDSGLITINTNGSIDNCHIKDSIDPAAVITNDLAKITNTDFTSFGSGHAVELTSIGSGSMTWNCTTVNYDAGVIGSPVIATNTGDEDIFVNVATGTLTIYVQLGSNYPSIRSAGAIVNIEPAMIDLKFTLNPSITGYEYAIYSVTSIGSLVGAIELQHEEVATQDNQTYTYTHSIGLIFAVQILAIGSDYVEKIEYYLSQDISQDVIINLTKDLNN